MKVSALADQGSSPAREDGLFVSPPFYGVLDGVSAPYNKWNPARLFEGLTGGEAVSRRIERFFANLSGNQPDRDLGEVTRFANEAVGEFHRLHGIPLDPALLAGATFAFAKVDGETVEIIQAGDCYAVWVMKDGTLGVTTNQVRRHDTEMNALIFKIMQEVAAERGVILEEIDEATRGEIRTEMWRRFFEPLREARREDMNNRVSPRCYGLLNGQKTLEKIWLRTDLPRGDVAKLILFSDGMFPFDRMKDADDRTVGEQVVSLYDKGGLTEVLRWARGVEEETRRTNYMNFAEATSIAIEF